MRGSLVDGLRRAIDGETRRCLVEPRCRRIRRGAGHFREFGNCGGKVAGRQTKLGTSDPRFNRGTIDIADATHGDHRRDPIDRLGDPAGIVITVCRADDGAGKPVELFGQYRDRGHAGSARSVQLSQRGNNRRFVQRRNAGCQFTHDGEFTGVGRITPGGVAANAAAARTKPTPRSS